MDFNAALIIFESGLRLAIPLVCACLAGLWSERAGIIDIGLEGKMLAAAFAGASFAHFSGSAWSGLLAAMIASLALALLHGFATINRAGNQIVSGMAINMIAAGLTALIGAAWFSQGGHTPPLNGAARFQPIWQGMDVLTVLALLIVPLSWFALYQTRFGLRLRAAGENPSALETAGVSVSMIRYSGVFICGLLCGLGGAYLSISQVAGFLPQMTAGKGFIALAALVFAKWRPLPSLLTCLLFGLLDATSIRLQGVSLPGLGQIPVQAIQSLPYVLTVILLAGFVGRATPPAASGLPYVKES
jgi:simple sugar transport system permease protein